MEQCFEMKELIFSSYLKRVDMENKVVQFKVFMNYCYLSIDQNSRQAVIIDPAWDFGMLSKEIGKANLDLQAVLLTHHHLDHSNLAGKFASYYDVPVYMFHEEIDYYGFRCKNLVPILSAQDFQTGEINIKPYLTPGHTKGSGCYLIKNHFFTGDTLFAEGCGLCNLDGGDPLEMYQSLQLIRGSISNETLIYPGHSYGTPPGKSFEFLLENNIYLHFSEYEKFAAFRMRKNQKGLFNFK